MHVKRFYESSLAQASYLIGCSVSGEALVIDPHRDADLYIAAAAQENLRIAHVTETHIHADFVSGSRELARRTGATLYLSDEGDAAWKYQFASEGRSIRDGDRFLVGNIRIDAVHTPGHTPEHLTYLITDGAAADRPIAAATGDFIFVGDVGRPDLLERAANIRGTMEAGARQLWRSLQAFGRHEDWLQIWPGHGAGSACGKGISAIPQSTLGYERRFNWAFRAKSEDEFVAGVLTGQPDPPTYFARMKAVNKGGPRILGGFAQPPHLDDRALADLVRRGAFVIDIRLADRFAASHLAGTINLPWNGSFTAWAGWLVPGDTDVYLVIDSETRARVPEVVRALALIGIDRVAGSSSETAVETAAVHGLETSSIPQIAVEVLAARTGTGNLAIVDVRADGEWEAGHLPSAHHIPLGHLADRARELPAGAAIVVHCQHGGRAAIAASVLKKAGFTNVANLTGGYAAWHGAGLPTVSS